VILLRRYRKFGWVKGNYLSWYTLETELTGSDLLDWIRLVEVND
jgi:hypothetical protein